MARSRTRLTVSLVVAYAVLLAISHGIRLSSSSRIELGPGDRTVELRPVPDDDAGASPVRVVYRETRPDDVPDPPTVLLLHGTPGRKDHLAALGAALGRRYRVIIPDLPGFGDSSRKIADFSMRAHGEYLARLLERLDVERVHVVGFSFGGGVALELYRLAPERVASLTMLSATGVQELELLGDYRLNRAIHGLQLSAVWLVHEGVPHMGLLDGSLLDVAYARNVYDSDQRPLRGILERFEPPMLIVHGTRDPLVPPAAAREHHRLVPHSELVMLEASHFLPFTRPGEISDLIGEVIERVESGRAKFRTDAEPSRLAEAALPFDPGAVPPASGFALVVLVLLIAVATFISEDLTCIVVGLMVARGSIGFVPGALACVMGIYVGDMAVYLAGRWLGRPIVNRAPVRWFLRPERLEASSRWFERRGPAVICISRFMPGTRFPTYLAAGILRTRFLSFSLWFLLAVVLWTPLLVGLAAVLGTPVLTFFERYGTHAALAAGATVVALLIVIRLGTGLMTHRGRRRLLSRWCRLRRWEFWPPWVFYPPVVVWILWLGVRFRGPTLFTAANPAMPAGGFLGESKSEILQALREGGAPVARFFRVSVAWDDERRIREAHRFMKEAGVDLPVVIKPDAGQRGEGVSIVRDGASLRRLLLDVSGDVILQEYVPGHELGVFYYRYPGEEHGAIFSVTDKRLPEVVGDGRRTLEQLILDDPRAVCMARTYLAAQSDRLGDVPTLGEAVRLVELGTHCRGAIFLNGDRIATPELERAIDGASRGYEGFYFGRYDIRGPCLDEMSNGKGFEIIELNGVTSESTDIYDPENSLFEAYRKLFRQWHLAFEIGALNRAAGLGPTGFLALARLVRDASRGQNRWV